MHSIRIISFASIAATCAACAAVPSSSRAVAEHAATQSASAETREDEKVEALEVLWQRRKTLVPDGARIDRQALRQYLGDQNAFMRLRQEIAADIIPDSVRIESVTDAGKERVWTVRETELIDERRFHVIATVTFGSTGHKETYVMGRTDAGSETKFSVLSLTISEFVFF